MQSAICDWVAEELARITPLNRLQTRYTVRLVLRQMGLECTEIEKAEMEVVIKGAVLRRALMLRGLGPEEAAQVVIELAHNLETAEMSPDRGSGPDVLTRFAS